MPAEIIVTVDGDSEDPSFVLVPPDHGMGFEVYDPKRRTKELLVIRCMRHDQGSDIFMFTDPGEGTELEEDALMELCTEDAFATQLDHETGCLIDMQTWDGRPLELIIGHNLTMSRN